MNTSSTQQRHTRQRDAILRAIDQAVGPLSIDELHQRALQMHAHVGIATVYRNLKLLQAAKQVQAVVMPTGETRYEKTGLGHHDHFQCRSCDLVFDLDACPLHLPAGATLGSGFVVEDHEMTLYGLCPDCSQKPRKHRAPRSAAHLPSHA